MEAVRSGLGVRADRTGMVCQRGDRGWGAGLVTRKKSRERVKVMAKER